MFLKQIEDRIFKTAAPQAVRYLARPDLAGGDPVVRRVLDQAAAEFQLAPPITLHLADPELLAGVWCALREAYLVDARRRALRELVAVAVSRLNRCPYCETVHGAMFAGSGGVIAGTDGPSGLSGDARVVYDWALSTRDPGADPDLARRLPADAVAQLFATAVMFHYLNRVVGIFLGETPVALPGMASGTGRTLARRMLGVFGRRIAALDPAPGRCSAAKDHPLPAEFAWASAAPPVAAGLAQFAASAEQAGRHALSDPVRSLVSEQLTAWRGEQPPISRAWLDPLLDTLADDDRPAARLALLAALAHWQVDDGVIAALRRAGADDRRLLAIVAWSAFAAARRVAGWLPADAADTRD